MERVGILGTFWAWTFNFISFFINEVFLKELSLILAIIVSILTIFWYIGQMIMKRKELYRAIKDLFCKK